jgi:hypothetical protein
VAEKNERWNTREYKITNIELEILLWCFHRYIFYSEFCKGHSRFLNGRLTSFHLHFKKLTHNVCTCEYINKEKKRNWPSSCWKWNVEGNDKGLETCVETIINQEGKAGDSDKVRGMGGLRLVLVITWRNISQILLVP